MTTLTAGPTPGQRIHARRRVEELLTLCQHLPAPQRLLVEQRFRAGLDATQMARMSGCDPRRLQRRLRSLIRRVRHPLFAYLVTHGPLLPPDCRRVGEAVVFRGLSLRAAARELRLSLHAVRQQMRALRIWARQ